MLFSKRKKRNHLHIQYSTEQHNHSRGNVKSKLHVSHPGNYDVFTADFESFSFLYFPATQFTITCGPTVPNLWVCYNLYYMSVVCPT